jgi:hypothetical protein
MRIFTLFLLAAAGPFLGGCVSPPKPSDCQGEFRPVNAVRATAVGQAQSLALCTGKDGHENHV